ncbi:hypothetical protein LINGRAHAP2_LOCUS31902 [Linum grandiflorum]
MGDLISTTDKEWNAGLLHYLFDALDVQEILAIPITVATGSNKLIWNCSRNGLYLVKSAYHLAYRLTAEQSLHEVAGD